MTDVIAENEKLQRWVPIIDIVFENSGVSGGGINDKRLIISHPKQDVLLDTQYENGMVVSYNPRTMSKFTRKINKNPIYINFPVETEDNGGYAYDLGFTEDSISIGMNTAEWSEYEKVCRLVKVNVGEKPATVHIGRIPEAQWSSFVADTSYQTSGWSEAVYTNYGCKSYRCIVRNSDVTFEPGTQLFAYNIECTVVYNG